MNRDHNELAHRDEQRLHVRSTPLRLRWQLDNLITADAHRLVCEFSCAVRLLDQPAERQMLEESLLSGRARLTIDDLVEHFQPSLASTAASIASRHRAVDWIDSAKPAMSDALRAAATTIAFSCGVEILAPFQLNVHSPTLRRQILESAQRQLTEQRAAGRIEQFQRAIKLLSDYEAMRQASPHLRFGQLLEHVNPSDQAPLLAALTHAHAEQNAQTNLYVVEGTSLIRINTRAFKENDDVQHVELSSALGPFRSVQSALIDGDRHLLIGARAGMISTPVQRLDAAVLMSDPETTSALGFTRAVYWDNSIWACHGDAGLLAWSLNDPSAPHKVYRPAQLFVAMGLKYDADSPGPRHLTAVDDARLIFALGGCLVTLDRNGAFAAFAGDSHDPIAAIVPAGDELLVVRQNGLIERRRRDSLEPAAPPVRRGQNVIASAALPWLAGEVRLLIAEDRGAVTAVGLDDTLITQYLSDHQGARMLTASANVVAAASMDRQRLILWNSWDGAHPRAEFHVAARTKHRIADIEMA